LVDAALGSDRALWAIPLALIYIAIAAPIKKPKLFSGEDPHKVLSTIIKIVESDFGRLPAKYFTRETGMYPAQNETFLSMLSTSD
jgi:hypothetical protein